MPTVLPSYVEHYLPFARALLTAVVVLVVGFGAAGWIYRLCLRALTTRRLDPALGRFQPWRNHGRWEGAL